MNKKIFAWLLFGFQFICVVILFLFSADIKEIVLKHGKEYEFPVSNISYEPVFNDDFIAETSTLNVDFIAESLIYIGKTVTESDSVYIRILRDDREGFLSTEIDYEYLQMLQPLFQNAHWVREASAIYDNTFTLTGIGEGKLTAKFKIAGPLIKYEGLCIDGMDIEDYFK